jgi:hypothetical protein
MNFRHSNFGRFVHFIAFSVLCFLIYSSSISMALGQKKPTALKLDVDTDDSQICGTQGKGYLNGTQFCALYRSYYINLNAGNLAGAQADRNEMIEIVRGQVDTYYKLRKDGRSTKIRWLQTVLDFLEIGGALAITIMNGERAKTIAGAAIGALQGGRTVVNKNFELLQTQVLINKMNTKRAQIFTEIVQAKDKPVRAEKASDAYSWYQAKNDLRRYLLAGTFDDALDSLVRESGAEVVAAERKLRVVEKGLVVGEIGPGSLLESRNAAQVLIKLRTALTKEETKDAAQKTLRAIVAALSEDDERIAAELSAENITTSSEGETIRKALMKIRSKFLEAGDDDLVDKINQAIVEQSK